MAERGRGKKKSAIKHEADSEDPRVMMCTRRQEGGGKEQRREASQEGGRLKAKKAGLK